MTIARGKNAREMACGSWEGNMRLSVLCQPDRDSARLTRVAQLYASKLQILFSQRPDPGPSA
jgi:hypothetical protein